MFHKLSFGHRNHRTFVVVVYDPASPSCRAAEYEVERLATGLRHTPSVVVARLNAAHPPTAAFLAATFNLTDLPTRLPAVLLYPEAATGYIRLKGRSPTAEDVLRGINKLYGMVLPRRQELQLRDVAEEELAERLYGGTAGLERQRRKEQFRRLLEEVADAREAAAVAAAEAEAKMEAGEGEAKIQGQLDRRAREPVTATVLAAPPAGAGAVVPGSYWTREKASVWGLVAGLSLLAFAWDMWLAAAWDRWQLERRQTKRARGIQLGREQDLLDLGTLLVERLEEGKMFAASGRQLQQQPQQQSEPLPQQQQLQLQQLPQQEPGQQRQIQMGGGGGAGGAAGGHGGAGGGGV